MAEKNEYEIVQRNGLDYVIVRCPQGHVCRAQKISEKKISYQLTCPTPSCNAQWSQLLPSMLEMEATEP